MKLNKDQNGRIWLRDNKELCLLSMAWTKINDPEVFDLIGQPGPYLKSFKDLYEEDHKIIKIYLDKINGRLDGAKLSLLNGITKIMRQRNYKYQQ